MEQPPTRQWAIRKNLFDPQMLQSPSASALQESERGGRFCQLFLLRCAENAVLITRVSFREAQHSLLSIILPLKGAGTVILGPSNEKVSRRSKTGNLQPCTQPYCKETAVSWNPGSERYHACRSWHLHIPPMRIFEPCVLPAISR